jgi:hypothetical protein
MLASKVKATQNMNLRQNNQAVHASIVTLPEFMEAVPAESRRRSPHYCGCIITWHFGGAQKLENGWRNQVFYAFQQKKTTVMRSLFEPEVTFLARF